MGDERSYDFKNYLPLYNNKNVDCLIVGGLKKDGVFYHN